MNNLKRHEILKDAIKVFGVPAQSDMCVEECAELIQALNKYRRKPSDDTRENVLEEIADVQIMIDQMKIAFDTEERVRLYDGIKVDRLERRIDEELKS